MAETDWNALAAAPALAMLVGAGVCLVWAANGHLPARAQARIEAGEAR